MVFKGGGAKGRSCIKVTSEQQVDKLYNLYRNKLEHMINSRDQLFWRYDKECDILYRKFEIIQEEACLRDDLSESELEKAKNCTEFDSSLMVVKNVPHAQWYQVPHKEFRREILQESHSRFHRGTCKMRMELKEKKIVWPKIQESIDNFVKTCVVCQLNKSPANTHVPFRTIISERPLQHIYFDISFLSRDNKFIGALTVIDHFTKRVWSEAITSRNSVVIQAILIKVFENIGLPLLTNGADPPFEMTLRSELQLD